MVEPLAMELYTINIDGTGLKKITQLGGSNWAPFFLNDNFHLIFSSNYNSTTFGTFNLYKIDENGNNVERVYFKNNIIIISNN